MTPIEKMTHYHRLGHSEATIRGAVPYHSPYDPQRSTDEAGKEERLKREPTNHTFNAFFAGVQAEKERVGND